ncbi:GIP3 GLC7-interacting protein 3 [Candida maltosa Xu316]
MLVKKVSNKESVPEKSQPPKQDTPPAEVKKKETTIPVPPTPAQQQEKPSKLNKLKLGRSRSSSASTVTSTQSDPREAGKRRSSSFNFISPSLTSDLVYDDHDSSALRSQNSNSATSSTTSSPGVTRSNSKKGLFSSLSSKFRSSTPTKNIETTTTTNNDHHHLNPNLLGSGSHHHHHHHHHHNQQESYQDETPAGTSPTDHALRFFKRRTSQTAHTTTSAAPPAPRVVLNKNPNREKVLLEDLQDLRLRRVTFAVDKLEHDPQQQIPSRRPKRGNVLIPQDINAPVPRLCLGISVENKDGSSHNNHKDVQYTDQEIALAEEAQRKALLEAEKHAQEAHKQAKKIAQEVSSFKLKRYDSIKENYSGEDDEQDDEDEEVKEVNEKLANDVSVDGPLHVHEQHFEDEVETGEGISLETIYTRCCHLREILPIPATLKQLKNKTAPLEVLKMLNPKPTLIDVLSFSDFIAITPINTVIFDNVTMSTEMLKNFLGSLIYNRQLEKLSLRNVAIDELGWKYLCKFLAKNKTIKKLDISQQRIKPDTSESSIRGNMNWELFIQSLILRGGIEELVINGCKLSDQVFDNLINKAVRKTTYRLGIAGIDLNMAKATTVTKWLSDPESKCVGVDVAFNDLSQGQLRPFIDAFNRGVKSLIFFSLNSTNLSNVDEVTELLKSMVNLKGLRFLDLSSIPDIFPGIITSLAKYLPLYPNLRRIHFDLNELTPQAIGSIAGFLVKIPHLVHVSLLGNRNLSHTAAASLYSAVKHSNTLFALDLDYDLVSDELSQRIAFYLMRNMDRSLKPEYAMENSTDKPEDLMFDGSLLMETAEKLLMEIDKGKKDDLKMQKIISDTILDRTRAIRNDIHKTIDTLFEQRKSGSLSFEGKENLVRFCLLDSSLEKLVLMFEEHASLLSPSTSQDTRNDILHPTINIHQSATELITAGPILSPHVNRKGEQSSYFLPMVSNDNLTPHQVVVESNNGKDVPVDKQTGRPVVIRSLSQTSVHAKEQEIEEGELHKFGFFMQQNEDNPRNNDIPILNTLPSGSELRDAIMAAKGVENVTELIDRINTHRVKIDVPETKKKPVHQVEEVELSDTASIDSHDEEHHHHHVNPMVDEVYEKLLNDAERVRSNRDA